MRQNYVYSDAIGKDRISVSASQKTQRKSAMLARNALWRFVARWLCLASAALLCYSSTPKLPPNYYLCRRRDVLSSDLSNWLAARVEYECMRAGWRHPTAGSIRSTLAIDDGWLCPAGDRCVGPAVCSAGSRTSRADRRDALVRIAVSFECLAVWDRSDSDHLRCV